MTSFFALNSKAIWAVGLGLAGAVGAGTLIKTDSGQPLAVAFVEKIRGSFDVVDEQPASKKELMDKSALAKKEIAKDSSRLGEKYAKKFIAEPKQKVSKKTPEIKLAKPEFKEQEIAKQSVDDAKDMIALKNSNAVDATQKAMPAITLNKKNEIKKVDGVEVTPPSIDLLRVSRDGYVVMAGRAEPNSKVLAYNGSTQIGETKSNATGDYVFVFEESLKTGEHELIIRAGNDTENMKSSLTSGVIILPDNKEDMIVLLSTPGEASKILQMPSSRFGPKIAKLDDTQKSGDVVKATPKLPIAINAVDVEDKRYYIAGAATPQSTVNVYIDNKFKGKAITGEEGAFLYYGRESISVGQHALRVDMLGPDNITVIARAEVVLVHETQDMKASKAAAVKMADSKMKAESKVTEKAVQMVANVEKKMPTGPLENAAISSGSTGKQIANIGAAPLKKSLENKEDTKIAKVENSIVSSDKIIANDKTDANMMIAKKMVDGKKIIKSGSSVIIRRGDSLWKVSRRKLGEGSKYTIIYSANLDQVKNPHLIYPGQVLKIPEESNAAQ